MTFSFRWGVELFDNSRTEIPNMIFAHYHEITWTDNEGNPGVGISSNEIMFILHLASFRFEREGARANPALGTIVQRMGFKTKKSARQIKNSLEKKGLLIVHQQPGKPSDYDFTPFSKAIIHVATQQNRPEKGLNKGGIEVTPLKQGGYRSNPPETKGGYRSNPPETKGGYKNTPPKSQGGGQEYPTGGYKNNPPKVRGGIKIPHRGGIKIPPNKLTTKGDFENLEIGEIFKIYEANIGSIAPLLAEDITDTCQGLTPPGDETKLQWFHHAVKTAVENNVLKWTYIRAILDGIQKTGSLVADQQGEEGKAFPTQPFVPAPITVAPGPPVPIDEDRVVLDQIKELLSGQMTKATYGEYVATAVAGIEQKNGVVKFLVSTPLALDWLDNRLKTTFERATKLVLPSAQGIEFVTAPTNAIQPALI